MTSERTTVGITKDLLAELRKSFPNWSIAAILRYTLEQHNKELEHDSKDVV